MRNLEKRLAALEAVDGQQVVAVQLVDVDGKPTDVEICDGTHTRMDRATFEQRYPHALIVDYVYVDQWDLL